MIAEATATKPPCIYHKYRMTRKFSDCLVRQPQNFHFIKYFSQYFSLYRYKNIVEIARISTNDYL